MSLRKPSGEDFEKPISPEKFTASLKKSHTLIQCGPRGWRCVCGKIYSWAKNRSDAQTCQLIHQNEVVEFMTGQREGRSNYGDD